VGYGVGPSCADAPFRDYKLARNKNCPGERAIIDIMTHEVIYPLTIYPMVQSRKKEKMNNRILHCPKIEEGKITKIKLQTYYP